MSDPQVVVRSDAEALADEVAARTAALLAAAQQAHGRAAIALTAGSIMEKVWTRLADKAFADALDWDRVDVFWGDERFVAHDSKDRNDLPAERILFGQQPFSAAQRYSMPASDGEYGTDLEAAAAGYAATLQAALRTGGAPLFDVVLLGVGPDGHCCSLFPRHPGLSADGVIIAVRNSPKPPPLRLSFSFDTLNGAAQILVVASGEGKADAVAAALSGASREEVPSAGARGQQGTVWLLDADAAAKLPASTS